MDTQRRIGFLAFDGVQALDLIGPADAFASDALNNLAGETGQTGAMRPYEIIVIGLTGMEFVSTSGVHMRAHVGPRARVALDTLIVPGGVGLRRGGVDQRAAAWIAERASKIRRIASVCTGLYGLAPSGLLNGCQVTTHWSAAADIAQRYPALDVQPNAIFIKAGKFYTSAGITAGVDLALSIIEEDLGASAALAVAREMVVYLKRPGGQNQFSEPLEFQFKSLDRFKNLAVWIRSHLRDDLSVDALAAHACLSPRHFARVFREEFETTPAAFVEEARLSEARLRLSSPRRKVTIADIARSVGYASDDIFRLAFERRYGVSPTLYRGRFRPEENS